MHLFTELTESPPEPRVSSKIAHFQKGTGGRASFSGQVVTVFGSTGFLGLPVVNRLAKRGVQLIIPYRSDPYWVREHKVIGELGQILFFPFQLKDEDSIRKAIKYSNVVVNLIGSRFETKNFSFEEVHVNGARRLARLSKEMGVERFIHVSALNADKNPEPKMLRKGSQILRTKALGEEAVREEFPEATIIRPSVMFGESDYFIENYVNRFRKNPLDLVWVYKAGEQTYKSPVMVNDVALGIAKAVTDPLAAGKTYEFTGPHCYKFSELMDYMYKKAHCLEEFGFKYRRHGYYDPLFRLYVRGCELWTKFWKSPAPLSWEWIEFVECTNDVLTGAQTFEDIGVRRLTEFEFMGGQLAKNKTFYPFYEERWHDLDPPPLPLRSPILYSSKPKRSDSIKVETKSFAVSGV
uniref:NADH dehydrogenase [ubiquinone] 1 alpha subcomplex subunit 9, mitochondrial n=1 Tax=Acrobeloides nanus TaxID=290746 RepID=A0A914E7Z9_9BILA